MTHVDLRLKCHTCELDCNPCPYVHTDDCDCLECIDERERRRKDGFDDGPAEHDRLTHQTVQAFSTLYGF